MSEPQLYTPDAGTVEMLAVRRSVKGVGRILGIGLLMSEPQLYTPEAGTVEMPALVRMAQSPAWPRSTDSMAAAIANTRAAMMHLNAVICLIGVVGEERSFV